MSRGLFAEFALAGKPTEARCLPVKLRRLAVHWPRVVVGLGLAVVLLTVLLLKQPDHHPNLSRQTAIAMALQGQDRTKFARVAAKLMHRRDLYAADPGGIESRNNDELIWVVAVSGDFGIAASFPCCTVPSGYQGHNTWGIAIINDSSPPTPPMEFESSWHGDWPPFFDRLPDLASGT